MRYLIIPSLVALAVSVHYIIQPPSTAVVTLEEVKPPVIIVGQECRILGLKVLVEYVGKYPPRISIITPRMKMLKVHPRLLKCGETDE
jgi:hypothetical protein